MDLKSYIALDIETTGLDKKRSQVLEIAAIYDDLKSPVSELETFRIIIDNGIITYGESHALSMHSDLFLTIAKHAPECEIYPPNYAADCLVKQIDKWYYKNNNEKLTIAGKNVGSFDIPILENQDLWPQRSYFKHRILDVGSLYAADFGYVPNLDEVNRFLRRNSVSHKALDDCYDVVYAVRAKYGVKV